MEKEVVTSEKVAKEYQIMRTPKIPPKVIRLKDAPRYLGMNKNRFNKDIKPIMPIVRIGARGIGFDRLDLDQWVEDTKQRNECPVLPRRTVWDKKAKKCQAWSNGAKSGTLTKWSTDSAFAKALERLNSQKQKGTSFED